MTKIVKFVKTKHVIHGEKTTKVKVGYWERSLPGWRHTIHMEQGFTEWFDKNETFLLTRSQSNITPLGHFRATCHNYQSTSWRNIEGKVAQRFSVVPEMC